MDEAGARARINSMTRPPDVKAIEKDIETIRAEKESAIKAQDFEKAEALRDSEKQTQDKLKRILNDWREKREESEVVVTGDAHPDVMHLLLQILAEKLLRENIKQGDTLDVHAAGEQLAFRVALAATR
jgi:ATP-dependent Clp protease ATP-binding subunit ClpC